MTERILLDPTGEHRPSKRNQAARPRALDGYTIGILDIGKARGNVFLDRLAERMGERGITVKRYAKPGPSRLVAPEVKARMLAEINGTIIGLAD